VPLPQFIQCCCPNDLGLSLETQLLVLDCRSRIGLSLDLANAECVCDPQIIILKRPKYHAVESLLSLLHYALVYVLLPSTHSVFRLEYFWYCLICLCVVSLP